MVVFLRSVALSFAILAQASFPAISQETARAAFIGIPEASRAQIQATLKAADLYLGTVDGKWGPSTETAVQGAAARLSDVGIHYDLDTEQGAESLLAFIDSTAGGDFLVPDGGGCPGCEYLDGFFERAEAGGVGSDGAPGEQGAGENGIPEWARGPSLPWDATLGQWFAADPGLKLRTAAYFQSSTVQSDARLIELTSSGVLLDWSRNLIACVDDFASFGLNSGQKSTQDRASDIARVCASMLGQF